MLNPTIGPAQRGVIAGFLWQAPILPPSEQQHQAAPSNTTNNKGPNEHLDWQNWTKDPIAVFTFVLTIFNGLLFASSTGLWLANRKTAKIAQDQIRLGRDEFTASHRPRMRLKHIWLATPDGQRSYRGLQSQAPVTVRLDIVNNGDAVGFVRIINFVTRVLPQGQRLPQRPIYNEPDVPQLQIPDAEVRIGRTLTLPASDGRILSANDIFGVNQGSHRLYFVGTIEYWWGDDRGNLRQTAFCRFLTGTSGRFQVDKDPDYDYED
jgi:hypothetical protein